MENIQMVDLKNQYLSLKEEIDTAIQDIIDTSSFINGSKVKIFQENLSKYLNTKNVITCGNGTDALQIALMSLDLQQGDEVIVPAFTYVATAEVIALLGLTPVLVDVDFKTFNIDTKEIVKAISDKTRAIIPVHLFGQSANMTKIMKIAKEYNLYVIEDNAQAIGSDYYFDKDTSKKTGTIGNIGCTSFFPSKNLGCFGDGGAIFTDNNLLADKIRMIANHGQNKKYFHKYIGVNSRLDSIQAAILDVKLKYLDNFNTKRLNSALIYTEQLKNIEQIITPIISENSSHVFHQYTIIIKNNKRNELKEFLNSKSIPANIYYPMPLNEQQAFKNICKVIGNLENTYKLCESVLSLPIHTELTEKQQLYITDFIASKFY